MWGCSFVLSVEGGEMSVQGTYTFGRGHWYEITTDGEGHQFINSRNVSAPMNIVATVIGV